MSPSALPRCALLRGSPSVVATQVRLAAPRALVGLGSQLAHDTPVVVNGKLSGWGEHNKRAGGRAGQVGVSTISSQAPPANQSVTHRGQEHVPLRRVRSLVVHQRVAQKADRGLVKAQRQEVVLRDRVSQRVGCRSTNPATSPSPLYARVLLHSPRRCPPSAPSAAPRPPAAA